MAEWVKDITKETWLQKDRLGVRRHRGRRLWLEKDSDQTGDLDAAITAAISEASGDGFGGGDVALVSVRARVEGNHVWYWFDYDPVSFVNQGQPSPDMTFATIQITSMNIISWAEPDTIGGGTGGVSTDATIKVVKKTWNPQQAASVRQPKTVTVPIWHIRIFFEFDTSQAGSNSDMIGKTNDYAFGIGNRDFPAKTMLFQGVVQDVRIIDPDAETPTAVFTGYFEFTYRPDGWYNYVLTNENSVEMAPMYPELRYTDPVLEEPEE